jgi:hypothetical protein
MFGGFYSTRVVVAIFILQDKLKWDYVDNLFLVMPNGWFLKAAVFSFYLKPML